MTSPTSDSRRQVLSRAIVAVEKAARNGGVINATVEARRIMDESNAGDMSLDHVAVEIGRLASERGLGVEFGEAP